ncbi:MAG: hypothetical protein JRI54_00150 [Deltaproteobacteria bacterium]|nr:hypothetical protein [Deltaproteobacteria bacterium]
MRVGTIEFKIGADTRGFEAGLARVHKKLDGLQNVATRFAKRATVALAGFTAVSMGLVAAASKQREAELKLAAAIKGTGQAINIEKIKRYASQLQKLTKYGDEATIEAAAMLTTFQLTEKQILDLLPRVQNLAAMYNMDLRQAAVQVGRALSTGAGALSRYGIVLTEAERKAFDAANQFEKIALLMRILDKNTGPAAREMTKTAMGAFTQMKNVLGDLAEQMGFIIEQPLVKVFQKITRKASRLVEKLSQLDDTTKSQIARWGVLAAAILGLVTVFGVVVAGIAVFVKGLTLIGGVIAFIAGILTSPFMLITAGLSLLYVVWKDNWGGIRDKTLAVWDAIRPVFETLWDYVKKAWNWVINIGGTLWEALKSGDWATFFGTISDLWSKGAVIAISLMLAKGAAAKILTAIGSVFGNVGGKLGIGGLSLGIGLLTVGIKLSEAIAAGSFKKFGQDMALALAAGIGIGVFTGSPQAGVLAFTIALNLELGSGFMQKVKEFGREFGEATKEGFRKPLTMPNLGELFKWRFQEGAVLPGAFGPDQFPALLAPGEAVVPAKIVQGGLPAVAGWFRAMGVPGFQEGYAPQATVPGLSEAKATVTDMRDMFRSLGRSLLAGFTRLFEIIATAVEKLAIAILGEEKVEQIKSTFAELRTKLEDFIDSFFFAEEATSSLINIMLQVAEMRPVIEEQKTLWQQLTDSLKSIKDFAIDKLLQNIPIVFAAIQGAQAGAAGGPVGMAAGALTAVISNSQTFAQILNIINPLLQAAADAVGMLLQPLLPLILVISKSLAPVLKVLSVIFSAIFMPVLQALFPVFKLLGIVVSALALGIAHAWNAVARAINWALGWLGVHLGTINTEPLQEGLNELANLTWDSAMAQAQAADSAEDLAETADKVSQSLRNIPAGFKYVLTRFQVARAIPIPGFANGGYIPPTPGGRIVRVAEGGEGEYITPESRVRGGLTINIYGDVYGYDDFERKVNLAVGRRGRSLNLAGQGVY